MAARILPTLRVLHDQTLSRDVRERSAEFDLATPAGAFTPAFSYEELAAHSNEIRPMWMLEGHTDYVMSLAFAPDSRVLASSSEDGTVRFWNTADGHVMRQLTGGNGPIWEIAFSPDGQLLATGAQDGTVGLWDSSGHLIHSAKEHTEAVTSVAFSSDGTVLASAR